MKRFRFLNFFLTMLLLCNSLKSVLILDALEKDDYWSTVDTLEVLKDCFSKIGSFFPSPENLYCDNTKELYDLNDRNCMNYFYYTLNKYVCALQQTLKFKDLFENHSLREEEMKEALFMGPYFFLNNKFSASSNVYSHVQEIILNLTEVKIWLYQNVAAQEEIHFIQKILDESTNKINRAIIFSIPPFFSLQNFTDKCIIIGLQTLFEIITRVQSFHRMFLSRENQYQISLLSQLGTIKKRLIVNYNFEAEVIKKSKESRCQAIAKCAFCITAGMIFLLSLANSSTDNFVNA